MPAQAVTWAGIALALAGLALLAALARYERQERLLDARERMELVARVLEEHATRSIDTASLAMAALADAIVKDGGGRLVQDGSALAQTLAGLPLLRGVAVVDERGVVLAGSTPGDAGRRIDMARLGPLPPPGSDHLGRFLPGRGLSALAPGARDSAPAGVGFAPMVRTVGTVGGRTLVLLGLVNPDAIGNHQQQTLDDGNGAALLADYEGQVLAATGNVPIGPGADLRRLPVFADYLPETEHANYVGAGIRPGPQIVAFRASRTRPLVVVVEVAESAVLAQWWHHARWLLAVGAGAMTVVALMTLVAVRSLRTREAAHRQRDAAQAEVAAREQELSAIVQGVQELIFRADAAGRLTFVNPRWLAATGLPVERLLGTRLADLVDPASHDDAAALFGEGDGPPRHSHVILGGHHFDVAVTALGEPGAGFAGSAVDVTERQRSEARLAAQYAFSALLLETMPVPVSLLDRDGRYVSVNRAWEEFTGRRRVNVVGQRARNFLPPEEARVHDEHDRQLLAEGGRVRYESHFTHRDGGRRHLSVTKAAVPDADGRTTGVLVCLTDISEMREAERATREARDAAEEASRAKSEFIANISHELRTPLQSIIGFSELGQARAHPHARLASMFGDIHTAGQRMLALVNDLLDVSKIESTVGTFHLERTDVRPLVREVARELQPLLAARRLGLQLALDDVPLVAKVDPLRFQQVVRNVLANALKFSPEGASIDLDATLGADGLISISVRDRGPGIPPAELEKIFEAFVQSSKTKDGSGGTGLGLAICRKIVEAHGGRIVAENADGGGSCFTIVVPARSFAESVV